MPTCSSTYRLARARTTDRHDHLQLHRLEALATALDEGFVDSESFSTDPDDHPSPLLVSAIFHDDDVEVMLKPVSAHPVDELLGFTAPPDWSCLGVASGGWASAYDTSSPNRPRPSDVDRRRVRLLHLVARTGASINILREAGAEPVVQRDTGRQLDDRGQIDECCRRALDLPTAPAPADTREFWAAVWIDRVLARAAAGGLHRAAWPSIAALHPAFAFAATASDPDLTGWVTDHLARAGEIYADANPWSELRATSELGAGPLKNLPADIVRWMDEGMYARMARCAYPDLEEPLLDLNALLEADTYCRLVDTIEAWGLLA